MPKIFPFLSFAWLALVVSISAEAAGCPPEPVQPTSAMLQAAKRNARDHGFLWRISKDGHASYLYGTMHVARYEWVFTGPKVTQALRDTDTLALEIDMLDPNMQERFGKALTAASSPALPEALQARLRKLAESVCVRYDSFAALLPELQVELLLLYEGRREGLDASFAIDAALAAIAHNAHKNVISLETPEFQLSRLKMPTEQETIGYVRNRLDEFDKGQWRKLHERTAQVWANADYAGMEHFTEWCECLETDLERKMMKRLLDDRNPGMAERIDALHRDGKRVFAAVGSLHLFGVQGLPELMKQRGYQVERIELEAAANPQSDHAH